MRRGATLFFLLLVRLVSPLHGDSSLAQHGRGVIARESFDSVTPPALPPGWVSSRLRQTASDDFIVSASSPHSPPQAAYAVNATLGQWLLSPPWPWVPCGSLEFWIRRSATFGAALLVESSFDDGATFPLTLGDTLQPSASSTYFRVSVVLPDSPARPALVRFRWRVLPAKEGSAGTFRLDDVLLATDTAAAPPPLAFPPGSVVVNEIMAAPAPGEPEWVELLNTRAEEIHLAGWRVSDASVASRHLIPDVTIPSAGFAVLTRDSAALVAARGPIPAPLLEVPGFPSLNNDADLIVLCDPAGTTIDSVAYDASWHSPAVADPAGRSLERLRPDMPSNDPRNWTSSASRTGATPGQRNSVFIETIPRSSALSCGPSPFSPDADGIDDAVLIRYTIPAPAAVCSITIYNVRGRIIRHLADHEPSGPTGMIAWDGRDDNGVRAPIGMYVVLLQAAALEGGTITSAKAVVVLALPL